MTLGIRRDGYGLLVMVRPFCLLTSIARQPNRAGPLPASTVPFGGRGRAMMPAAVSRRPIHADWDQLAGQPTQRPRTWSFRRIASSRRWSGAWSRPTARLHPLAGVVMHCCRWPCRAARLTPTTINRRLSGRVLVFLLVYCCIEKVK
jgi:hypothetical protein